VTVISSVFISHSPVTPPLVGRGHAANLYQATVSVNWKSVLQLVS
jgi:hypothetical protein